MLNFTDIQTAATRIKGVAHRTPILTSTTLNAMLGCEVFMKAENFQRMGAFKFRGGYNAINALTDAERGRGVLAFSSGNHAQAVALAARLHGCTATILMPADAPNAKLDATREFIIEPHIRFKGEPGEQATMFFLDPSGNAIEFKAFEHSENLFAK